MVSRITTRAAWTTLAVTLLLGGQATPAQAFGTPTYIIYVDGPNGGTIEASGGALALPEGACGMRLLSNNVLAWYWAEGDVFPIGELNVPNNGWQPPANVLTELIEFTGQFGGDCEGEYVFHTPATPTAEPPPGAIALVVQFVDPDDVVFLNENFQIWEAPEPSEPQEPPDQEDICEAVPEFCEGPVGSFVEDPCASGTWSELCDDAEALGQLGFGVGHIVEPPILGLSALNGTSADVKILRTALARVSKATAFDPAVKHAHATLIRRADGRLISRDGQRWLSRTAVAASLAGLELQQCKATIERTLRTASTAARSSQAALSQARRASAVCTAAATTFADAHGAASRLRIGLRNERQ